MKKKLFLFFIPLMYFINFVYADPNITIIFPVNNTDYNVSSLDLNWTSNETLVNASYNLDSIGNVSLTKIVSFTISNSSINIDNPDRAFDGSSTTFATCGLSDCYFLINYTPNFNYGNISIQTDSEGETTDDYIGVHCWDYILPGWFNFFNISPTGIKKTYNNKISDNCFDITPLRINLTINNSGGETTYIYKIDITNELNITYNLTLTSLSDGTHNVTVYGENTDGQQGQSSYVYFNVSTLAPVTVVADLTRDILSDSPNFGNKIIRGIS